MPSIYGTTDKSWYDRVDRTATGTTAELVRTALTELFPRLAAIWGNVHHQPSEVSVWDRKKRVAAPRRFPAFFRFELGPNVLSQSDLERAGAALMEPLRFTEFVEEIAGGSVQAGASRVEVLVDELRSNPELVADAARVCSTLLQAGDALLRHDTPPSGGFTIPLRSLLVFLLREQLRRVPSEGRYPL